MGIYGHHQLTIAYKKPQCKQNECATDNLGKDSYGSHLATSHRLKRNNHGNTHNPHKPTKKKEKGKIGKMSISKVYFCRVFHFPNFAWNINSRQFLAQTFEPTEISLFLLLIIVMNAHFKIQYHWSYTYMYKLML